MEFSFGSYGRMPVLDKLIKTISDRILTGVGQHSYSGRMQKSESGWARQTGQARRAAVFSGQQASGQRGQERGAEYNSDLAG
jgi:hypothetical protein